MTAPTDATGGPRGTVDPLADPPADPPVDPRADPRADPPVDPRAELGRRGEDIAAAHLMATGLDVLDRNWRCRTGELDIVAREGDLLVAVEVKTRRSTRYGAPVEAVDDRRVARLHLLAWLWRCAHRPIGVGGGTRVDVVSVLIAPHSEPVVEHVRGLW